MEEVLVFPAEQLNRLLPFQGMTRDIDRYLPHLLDPRHLEYHSRDHVETDPSYKQLIPYAILRSTAKVFGYARSSKGSETRLHDRLSIGVGGHICREDGDAGTIAYEAGYKRELAEEVEILSTYRERIVGIVYDPSTPVGQVHVGIVHLLDLETPSVRGIDPALAQGRFWSFAELQAERDRLETWSQLTLELAFDHS